jgi:hypothetical protein
VTTTSRGECIELCEADIVMSSQEGMYLKWGTVGGRGKGNGEQMGGGEVSLQPTTDLSGRESHHDAKEVFRITRAGIFPRSS